MEVESTSLVRRAGERAGVDKDAPTGISERRWENAGNFARQWYEKGCRV